MTDEAGWSAPGASASAGADEAAPAVGGQPPLHGHGGPGAHWDAPRRPGLVPLRPMTLGTILSASFSEARRNPKPTVGVALLLVGVVTLISLAFTAGAVFLVFSRIDQAASADLETIQAGGIALLIVSFLVPGVLSIVVTAVIQGIVALDVARGTLGQKLTLAGLWRQLRPSLGRVILWTLLTSTALLIVVAVLTGVVISAIAIGVVIFEETGTALGVLAIVVAVGVGVLLVLAAIAAVAWLGTKLSLVSSAIVLERLTVREGIGRSWRLVTGSFWRVLGIQLLIALTIGVAINLASTPTSLITVLGSAVIGADPESGVGLAVTIVGYGLTLLVTWVASAIGIVVQSATASLLYIDLRMRREGLDLELVRWIDGGAEASGLDDPYLARATAPTGTGAGS